MHRSTRRAFLQSAGAAAVGLSVSGCAARISSPPGSPASPAPAEVRVRVDSGSNPQIQRAFAILADRIQQRSTVRVLQTSRRPSIQLALDSGLPAEAYRLESADGANGVVRVTGGSPRGLLYGVGKLLRTSRYDGGGFQASTRRGTSAPRGSLRGMYFATHFHNFYHQATDDEITRYVEDLALWGVNAFMVIFPMINLHGWDDPEAKPAMEMVKRYARVIRGLGLQFATGVNNTLFIDAPKNIRATRLPDPTGRRGNSGHPICPSNPEGHAYIIEHTRRLYAELAEVGLDIVVHWPYDEGGCACEHCQPWGSNGYLKLSRDLTLLGRTLFPKLKSVLSTWMFDTPPEGEWEGLSRAAAADRSWLDYILADAHEDFPRYPLDVGVPGKLPLLSFPEISMWGNSPWGGFGANPLPARFQRLWDQVKQVVEGGFPYSEGIYEDMNKAVVTQFYWDANRSARATLEEYVGYEFGPNVADDVLSLVAMLEQAASASYRKQPVDTAAARRGAELAEGLDHCLPEWGRKNWRWEILHLRALLDRERFGGGGLQTPAAEAALLRLIEIYHCQLETDDPYHHRVRPPLRRAISRAGNI